MKNIVLLIPVYLPNKNFVKLVNEFNKIPFHKIIVVDDGSGQKYKNTFSKINKLKKIEVLSHLKNKGKGAALKTGISRCITDNEILGIVTADADGQHSVSDINNIFEHFKKNNQSIILGVRNFLNKVPLRSKLGNITTKFVFRLIYKKNISDTQTGLRALPINFCKKIILLTANGYEFEMDMLISAVKLKYKIIEVKIKTIYEQNNNSSHFNPLVDSIKIYFSLFRFMFSSLATFIFDYIVFILCYKISNDLALSIALARFFAFPFYLYLNYNLVFNVHSFKMIMPMKLAIAIIIMGYISYYLQLLLGTYIKIDVSIAKIIVETILFFF